VTFKETSIQDSIESYDTRISDMNALLARKQEMLINKYTAMEVALGRIQNQSNWLASQMTVLSNLTW
jgi:flagellar hook-associated protein 2